MDTASAMSEAARAILRGDPFRDFNWKRAAEIILKEQPKRAVMGLEKDWGSASGTIYENGSPVFDSDAWGSSNWDIPLLVLHFADGTKKTFLTCWEYRKDATNVRNTVQWPQEALDILGASRPEPQVMTE